MSRFVVDVGAEDIARIANDLGARALAARRPKLLVAAALLELAALVTLLAGAPQPVPVMLVAAAIALVARAATAETKRWRWHAVDALPVGTYVFDADPDAGGEVQCVERPDGTRFPAPEHLEVLALPSGRPAVRGERPWWVLPAGAVKQDRAIPNAG